MGLLDIATAPIRAVLRSAEREVEAHNPVHETHELERKILEAVHALTQTTESIEKHVEVVESLATSLPPLTAAVTRLTDELTQVLQLTTPLAAAERDISRVGHLFHRHHDEAETPPAPE